MTVETRHFQECFSTAATPVVFVYGLLLDERLVVTFSQRILLAESAVGIQPRIICKVFVAMAAVNASERLEIGAGNETRARTGLGVGD